MKSTVKLTKVCLQLGTLIEAMYQTSLISMSSFGPLKMFTSSEGLHYNELGLYISVKVGWGLEKKGYNHV